EYYFGQKKLCPIGKSLIYLLGFCTNSLILERWLSPDRLSHWEQVGWKYPVHLGFQKTLLSSPDCFLGQMGSWIPIRNTLPSHCLHWPNIPVRLANPPHSNPLFPKEELPRIECFV